MSEKVLIVGGGGREHALGWKLAQSSEVSQLYFAPGNAGTQELGDNWEIPGNDLAALASQAKKKKVDLAVIGPDEALAAGAVDVFCKHKVLAFGPNQAAARLESSKAYAARFMARNRIPTAETYYASHQISHSNAYVWETPYQPTDYVIKADWLMGGKGVCLPQTREEASNFILGLCAQESYNRSNKGVLFQERLQGEELSVFILSDGKKGLFLPHCRDYKRLLDGNKGPNTGGMGAYGPVPEISKELETTIQKKIIRPTLEGMNELATPFQAILYIGLMLTKQGPKVLEYNVRFGDPECQVLMQLVGEDIFPLLRQSAEGKIGQRKVKTLGGTAITVALSAPNYGIGDPLIGAEIHGLDTLPEGVQVFHGGTRRQDSQILTAGGRVLHIATHDETLELARQKGYGAIGEEGIHFDGMHYRADIGA